MRRSMIAAGLAALLAACQPPAQQQAEAPAPGPQLPVCNDVAPNAQRAVAVGEEAAVAAARSDLRGGRITPGTYDLASATRIGAATGWQGTRAVALNVAENPGGGAVFNWASTPSAGGETDRWTASFTETPQPRIAFTCGRIGEGVADFVAEPNALQLRLQDGASGSLLLNFQRRT